MMLFDTINETTAIATNSIKEVRIVRGVAPAEYDRNTWIVFTPEGRLMDDFRSAGPFVSFEAAKRNAEENVGMNMNWSDF